MSEVKITRLQRLWRLAAGKRKPGVCRVCGCTMFDPCYHPKYGYCGWSDAEETVCTHCACKQIFLDPATMRRVNS